MIGAGGVATVAAHKIAQNPEVFTDFMIASRRKAKCDALVEALRAKGLLTPSAQHPSKSRRRRSMPTTWNS